AGADKGRYVVLMPRPPSHQWPVSKLKPAAECQRALQRPFALRLAIDRQETEHTSVSLTLYPPLSAL
ncbi:MAG: hypothetical protein RBT80_14085, partial [Candidatus Vecturithrix sp.]|nr:hypothetical protein [Candidatus Vecturithrix sp.]